MAQRDCVSPSSHVLLLFRTEKTQVRRRDHLLLLKTVAVSYSHHCPRQPCAHTSITSPYLTGRESGSPGSRVFVVSCTWQSMKDYHIAEERKMKQIFAWEMETGRSRVQGQSQPCSEFEGQPAFYKNPCQKKKKLKKGEGGAQIKQPLPQFYPFVILKILLLHRACPLPKRRNHKILSRVR